MIIRPYSSDHTNFFLGSCMIPLHGYPPCSGISLFVLSAVNWLFSVLHHKIVILLFCWLNCTSYISSPDRSGRSYLPFPVSSGEIHHFTQNDENEALNARSDQRSSPGGKMHKTAYLLQNCYNHAGRIVGLSASFRPVFRLQESQLCSFFLICWTN